MKRARVACLLIVALLIVPAQVIATHNDDTCATMTTPALAIGNFYHFGTAAIWEETNGFPGLQESACYAAVGGTFITRDECVTSFEVFVQLNCLSRTLDRHT